MQRARFAGRKSPEAAHLAIEHTDHIHSRVGHPEGPQVNDSGAPEWTEALNARRTQWIGCLPSIGRTKPV
ncbi:hypothetical protein [Larkinella harenae]